MSVVETCIKSERKQWGWIVNLTQINMGASVRGEIDNVVDTHMYEHDDSQKLNTCKRNNKKCKYKRSIHSSLHSSLSFVSNEARLVETRFLSISYQFDSMYMTFPRPGLRLASNYKK